MKGEYLLEEEPHPENKVREVASQLAMAGKTRPPGHAAGELGRALLRFPVRTGLSRPRQVGNASRHRQLP